MAKKRLSAQFPYKWVCSSCGGWQDSLKQKDYEKDPDFYDTFICKECLSGDPRDETDEFDNGPTGHGDICHSDADPGL